MKNYIIVIFCLLFLMIVSGCTDNDCSSVNIDVGIDTSDEMETIRNIGSSVGGSSTTSSSHGLYEMVPFKELSWLLMYSDYATMQQLYLCSQPDCSHSDETCSAYFTNPYGIIYINNNILLIQRGGTKDYPPHIDIINSNGTNRQHLAEFSASSSIGINIYSNEESLFFTLLTVEPNGESTNELLCLSLNNGVITTLKVLEGEGHEIFGCVGNQLVLTRHNAYDFYDTEDGIETIDEIRHIMKLYNPYTREDNGTIYERTDSEAISRMFNDGFIYEYKYSENVFHRYNLLDNTLQSINNFSELNNSSMVIFNYLTNDGLVIVDMFFSSGEKQDIRLLVDFSNNSISELTLRSTGLKTDYLNILGETADYFIVTSNYAELPFIDQTPDGTLIDASTVLREKAIITKEYFYENKPIYEYFSLL